MVILLLGPIHDRERGHWKGERSPGGPHRCRQSPPVTRLFVCALVHPGQLAWARPDPPCLPVREGAQRSRAAPGAGRCRPASQNPSQRNSLHMAEIQFGHILGPYGPARARRGRSASAHAAGHEGSKTLEEHQRLEHHVRDAVAPGPAKLVEHASPCRVLQALRRESAGGGSPLYPPLGTSRGCRVVCETPRHRPNRAGSLLLGPVVFLSPAPLNRYGPASRRECSGMQAR